jgi:hypothetical protein
MNFTSRSYNNSTGSLADMRMISRVLTTGMFSVLLLGVVGCGENNQSVVEKQATTGTVTTAKPENISDQKALLQRQQQSAGSLKQSGYPGAK